MIYIGIKTLVFSLIATGVYYLFLKKNTRYNFTRIYLLTCMPVSFILACISFPVSLPGTVISAYLLPVAEVGNNIETPRPGVFLSDPILFVYLAGAAVFGFIFFFRLLSALRFLQKYPGIKKEGYMLHTIPEEHSPGSFFHHIMMPGHLEEDTFPLVLKHELAHKKYLHSFDKAWMELLGILLYLNPCYWVIKKELYLLHEFQADEEVLHEYPQQTYKTLILATALHTRPEYIFQTFSTSHLKTRFMMMNKSKNSRWSAVRSLLVLPPLAVAAMAFTLPSSPWARFVPGSETRILLPAAEEEIVYPEFKGGQTAMFEFMGNHVKYPEAAKKNKIEGKVFVSFRVLKDGSITDVVLKRGVHESIDNEAIRVIKLMPAWKPGTKNGEPADFEMVLPVNFQLE